MNPDAYLPFYGSDFFAAVEGYRDGVAVGYMRALWHYWHHTHCSGLPDDDDYLRRVCRCESADWLRTNGMEERRNEMKQLAKEEVLEDEKVSSIVAVVIFIAMMAIGTVAFFAWRAEGQRQAWLKMQAGNTSLTNRPPVTYTVQVPDVDLVFTNVVEIKRNHEPHCTLVVYEQEGQRHEFHAWLVNIVATTNR